MSCSIAHSVSIVIAGLAIGAGIYANKAEAPSFEVTPIMQGFNNGFGAWRTNTATGEIALCSATPIGLTCSKPALEFGKMTEEEIQAHNESIAAAINTARANQQAAQQAPAPAATEE